MPLAAAMVIFALVPPTQILAGLTGWVETAGSATVVTVTAAVIASHPAPAGVLVVRTHL